MEASHKRSSMSRELIKLALEELQNARDHIYLLPENEQPLTEEQILNRINAAITVLHQEVYGDANDTSQKRAGQQEPVAWMHTTGTGHVYFRKKPQDKVFNPQPVFTAPPKAAEWQGLTDEEIDALSQARSLTDELMDCVDRLGSEADTVDPRVWQHLLVYAPKPEEEPVAWLSEGGDVSRSKRYMDEMGFKCNPLYTAPPKAAEWVGLTAPEVQECYDLNPARFASRIEAKLKEKNHG